MPSDVYNNEAEQLLLAAILRNPESYFDINAADLTSHDFVNRDHRYIFSGVLDAVDKRTDPTVPYIVEYLKSNDKSSTVDYVVSLNSVPCSIEQGVSYAKVVKSLSVSRKLGSVGAKIIDLSAEKRTDYDTAISEAEKMLRDLTTHLPRNERSPRAEDILKVIENAQEYASIPIEFSDTLQSMTGGMRPGHFWVVGGFSSTGKSAFASNVVVDALTGGNTVAIISAEMTQEQYVMRMLSILSGVPLRDIQSRVTIGLDSHSMLVQAKQTLSRSKLYVYDNLYRMPKIRTEMTRLDSQQGLDLLVLDYIQNVSVTGDEVSDAREVALECQRIAKDLSCTVLAFSQLSNAQAQYEISGGDDNYYSLKGHGSIRDAADVVLTLHRDRAHQSSLLKVKFRKNRHGPISDFVCRFNLDTGLIEEIPFDMGELDN